MNKLTKFIIALVTGWLCVGQSFADPCTELPGSWSGSAELKYFIFTCKYESSAVVNHGTPATANVKINKTSGSFFCPNQGDQTVAVSCQNGRVEMKDAKIDVAGYMSEDGQSAELEGNLYALFRYHPFKLSVTKD